MGLLRDSGVQGAREEGMSLTGTSAVSTTTTNFTATRLRGFTVELLKLLSNDAMSIFELSEITDRPLKRLRVYLWRLKKYGLIEGDSVFWTANHEGLYVLSLLSSRKKQSEILSRRLEGPPNIKSYSSESCTGNSKQGHSSITLRLQFDNTKITVPKQLTLENALKRFDLNDCEREVVEVLLTHYNRTGSPFKYVNYLEDLQLDYSSQILQEAIRKLRQDNIIYLWQDRAMNALKLGLKRAFLETLSLKP